MAGLLKDDGGTSGQTAVFICCGLGTMMSAFLGTAPICVSMSAAAGIREGGRTGLVSIVIGLLSILMAFILSPLAAAIPHCAVAPVLVLVGVSMAGETHDVEWWNMQQALPAFLCAVFQPFTYSITNGINVGIFMALALFFTTGTFRDYLPSGWINKYTDTTMPPEISELVRADSTRSNLLRNKSSTSITNMEDTLHDDEDSIRGMITRFRPRTRAVTCYGGIGAKLGYDEADVTRAIQYRLGEGAARDAAAHFNGGVPAWEAERVRQELAPQHEISAPDVVVALQLASRGKKGASLLHEETVFQK